MTQRVRLDAVIGREVRTLDGQRLGHVEECRVARDGDDWVVREWVIGTAGLIERLGLGALLVVGITRRGGYVARWDQLDVTNTTGLRLTCPVGVLKRRPD